MSKSMFIWTAAEMIVICTLFSFILAGAMRIAWYVL